LIVKNGLDITAPTVYVKKLNVSNYIEMKWADGNWYKIYIDENGSLQVQKIDITY
jgi:fibronectin type 3 domain-containing protein